MKSCCHPVYEYNDKYNKSPVTSMKFNTSII